MPKLKINGIEIEERIDEYTARAGVGGVYEPMPLDAVAAE